MTTFAEAWGMTDADRPRCANVVRWTPDALLAYADALGQVAREVARAGGSVDMMMEELTDVHETLANHVTNIALEAHGFDTELPAPVTAAHVQEAVTALAYEC